MKKRNALLVLAVAAVALLPLVLSPHLWKRTAQAEAGPLSDRLVLRAVVVAEGGIAEVAGPTTGRVVRVLVRAGDAVKAGQLLAEIAGETGATAAASRIEAPIDGTVLARRVDPGDSLAVAAQGAALFEIADTTRTEIHAEIEERDAGRVRVGQAVRLTTPGGRRTVGQGVVAQVTPRIERRTIGADDARVRADGAVQAVRIRWQGAAPNAPIGQRLEAEVALPKSAVIRVPRNAVVVRDGRTVVETPALLLWSREVPVVVGAADTALAEVHGLAPGTRVFLQ